MHVFVCVCVGGGTPMCGDGGEGGRVGSNYAHQ